jgi:hypothetical protein
MRRVLLPAVSIYLLAALIGRLAESRGKTVCGCAADCWCKKPFLSVFRWVFPFRHRSLTPGQKAALDQPSERKR